MKEDKYVSAKQLLKALQDSTRMIILDARSKAAWQQTHIPGSVSVPYYEEPDKFIKNSINRDTLLKKPLGLTEVEKKDLENFLLSLTDRKFKKKAIAKTEY